MQEFPEAALEDEQRSCKLKQDAGHSDISGSLVFISYSSRKGLSFHAHVSESLFVDFRYHLQLPLLSSIHCAIHARAEEQAGLDKMRGMKDLYGNCRR